MKFFSFLIAFPPMFWWCVAATIACLASAAGWCEGIERGESCGSEFARSVETQVLHLEPGERPRDTVWGSGLLSATLKCDVLVAGGGSAGTSAALAAARSGASVILIDGRPVLGGNSGSEVRLSMVGACGGRAGTGETNALKLECREGGIVEEYQLDNAVNNPDRVPELFSLELLTLIKAEPNIQLFQNTWLVGVTKANATITSAIVENQGAQRRYVVEATVYVDATGDGRLGAEAGAQWIQGREGFAFANESLAKLGFYRTADDGADHETEGTSLDYMAEPRAARNIFRPPFWAAKFNASQFVYRGVDGERTYGYWWNEISWPYNTITDGENVTQEALASIIGIWDYLKNSGDHPESAKMGLSWVGTVPCKREGRRFVGQYVQTQNDIMAVDRLCTRKPPFCPPKPVRPAPLPAPQEPELYWDRVAYAGWPFDLHNPKGMRDPAHPPFSSHKVRDGAASPVETPWCSPASLFSRLLTLFSFVSFLYFSLPPPSDAVDVQHSAALPRLERSVVHFFCLLPLFFLLIFFFVAFSAILFLFVSKDLTNLFFAGRLASFSHVVYGSQRVMKTCATMGQAVGTAAAYAVARGVAPVALKDDADHVWSIQQQLLRDDAFIIGAYNEDGRDYARRPGVSVSASSERANATAQLVLSGQSRAVVTSGTVDVTIGHGGGVPASQGKNGTNRWISQGLPASISLAFGGASPSVAIKQVQLTFDTGMHRTLSYSVVFKTKQSGDGPRLRRRGQGRRERGVDRAVQRDRELPAAARPHAPLRRASEPIAASAAADQAGHRARLRCGGVLQRELDCAALDCRSEQGAGRRWRSRCAQRRRRPVPRLRRQHQRVRERRKLCRRATV